MTRSCRLLGDVGRRSLQCRRFATVGGKAFRHLQDGGVPALWFLRHMISCVFGVSSKLQEREKEQGKGWRGNERTAATTRPVSSHDIKRNYKGIKTYLIKDCNLLRCKRNKTQQDVRLKENDPVPSGHSDAASPNRPAVDHFPTTARPHAFHSLLVV